MKRPDIKQLNKKDVDLISTIESHPLLKTYWKNNPILAQDLQKLKSGTSTSSYFLYTLESKPHLLFILCPLQKNKEEPLSPWIEEEGSTYRLTILPLDKGTQEQLTVALTTFLALADKDATLLSDPEVKDEKGVEALEQSGFKRVGSLVKGQGFFKGTPHHIMQKKTYSSTK